MNLKIVLWGLHTNLQVPSKELSKIPTFVFFGTGYCTRSYPTKLWSPQPAGWGSRRPKVWQEGGEEEREVISPSSGVWMNTKHCPSATEIFDVLPYLISLASGEGVDTAYQQLEYVLSWHIWFLKTGQAISGPSVFCQHLDWVGLQSSTWTFHIGTPPPQKTGFFGNFSQVSDPPSPSYWNSSIE